VNSRRFRSDYFDDKTLSASGQQSCSTCHVAACAFTSDPRQVGPDHGLPAPLGGPGMDLPGLPNYWCRSSWFDSCVAPHLEAWGYLPDTGVCGEESGGWRDFELSDERRIRFLRPLRLDLGGIARGYAVDMAVRALGEFDTRSIVVNASGDLRIAGADSQPIQLRHPRRPSHFAHEVMLCNAALATSAAYYSRRLVGGREVSALVDSRSGDPYVGDRSISVRAGDCMTADALAKVVMFADAAIAGRCLAEFDAEAYVLDPAL
jgi:FAD:protein FMN transferase